MNRLSIRGFWVFCALLCGKETRNFKTNLLLVLKNWPIRSYRRSAVISVHDYDYIFDQFSSNVHNKIAIYIAILVFIEFWRQIDCRNKTSNLAVFYTNNAHTSLHFADTSVWIFFFFLQIWKEIQNVLFLSHKSMYKNYTIEFVTSWNIVQIVSSRNLHHRILLANAFQLISFCVQRQTLC